MIDLYIALGYLFIFCLCQDRVAASALFGAVVTFIAAALMLKVGFTAEWFHLSLAVLCMAWAILMVTHRAIIPAIAISGFAIFQIMASLDSFIYPYYETALSKQVTTIAVIMHLIIMLTAYGSGIRFDVKRGASAAGKNT